MDDEKDLTNQNKNPEKNEQSVDKPAADSEEEMLQAASENVAQEEPPQMPPSELKPKKSKKKLLVVLLLLVLIAGGAAAAWYFLLKPDGVDTQSTQPEVVVQDNELTYQPSAVVYAFADDNKGPYVLYNRPANGGDRVQANLTLPRDVNLTGGDTANNNVAFSDTDQKVHVSTDNGQSYKEIFAGEAGQQVTGVSFSQDANSIAIAVLNESTSKNTVSTMNLDGSNKSELFTTSDHTGVDLMGWDDKTVVFNPYKPNGGGQSPDPYQYNRETKKFKKLVETESGQSVQSVGVSDDLTKLVYAYGQTDPEPNGLGGTPLAPHTIEVMDIKSGEKTEVAKVGEKGEKEPNGTTKYRPTQVGFSKNTTTPYWTDSNKLYSTIENSNTGSLIFESKLPIREVLYVGDKTVITTTAEVSSNDFTLNSFDIASQKSNAVLEGDANTYLIGITTN